ncbi:nitroreductase [Candidatus Magnetomorum sp. HK-1]|nr:nitroreductase [Candidatus Magnetomorum sp. HK-1]
MGIYQQSVQDIIKVRTSCRSYIETPIAKDKQDKINEFLKNNAKGPFDSKARFILVSATRDDNEALKDLGTYGVIKGANGFIIGACDRHFDKNMEDFGYIMEKIILFVTDMDLGSCWIGGTFSRSTFANKINVQEIEMVPAVTAIGNKRSKRTTLDSVLRWVAGSKNRHPWDQLFFIDDFNHPMDEKMANKYAIPLEMVRLGPSASNRQPWRIVKENNKDVFHFYLQRSKKYSRNINLLKLADLQRIDMGIAMCHFELSTIEQGLQGQWKITEPVFKDLAEETEYIITWVGKI